MTFHHFWTSIASWLWGVVPIVAPACLEGFLKTAGTMKAVVAQTAQDPCCDVRGSEMVSCCYIRAEQKSVVVRENERRPEQKKSLMHCT